MPTLDPIGVIDDPAAIDFDPLVVPVVGYQEGGVEVVERFAFRSSAPAGSTIRVLRAQHQNDAGATIVPFDVVFRFLDDSLLPGELERWQAFLDRPDLTIEQGTLVEVYQAVMAFYGSRPTVPSSGSQPGRERTQPTSRGASRSPASNGSKAGTSRKRSTSSTP